MAEVLGGIDWSLERDENEGWRDYYITLLVKGEVTDPPQIIAEAPGLPTVGSVWTWNGFTDPYCYCSPSLKAVRARNDQDPDQYWKLTYKFTNRPLSEVTAFDNPLLAPPKLSGSFTKLTRQATVDKDGAKIASSSHEPIHWEVDDNRPTVRIEMNFATVPIVDFSQMVDRVNSSYLWGLPARCVKLANVSWQRHAHTSLGYYYTVTYDFEIKFDTFDLFTFDYGTLKLKSGGTLSNPEDFEYITDRNGNPKGAFLNGSGVPITDGAAPVLKTFKYYKEANFYLLGISSSL